MAVNILLGTGESGDSLFSSLEFGNRVVNQFVRGIVIRHQAVKGTDQVQGPNRRGCWVGFTLDELRDCPKQLPLRLFILPLFVFIIFVAQDFARVLPASPCSIVRNTVFVAIVSYQRRRMEAWPVIPKSKPQIPRVGKRTNATRAPDLFFLIEAAPTHN
jgi:hypothetical protein